MSSLLDAAQRLLDAHRNQMVTAEEWEALERAVETFESGPSLATAAHTPGPWTYCKGGAFNPDRWGIVERQSPTDPEDGETICEICVAAPGVAEADARLIASVLDLAAACGAHGTIDAAAQLLASFADGSIEDHERREVPQLIETLTAWAMAARAALAKAGLP